MEYVRFDDDNNIVKQVIGLIAENRKDVLYTEDWFGLRYLHNPFGKAIIACGLENGKAVACIVIEQLQLFCHGKVRHCGIVSTLVTKKELLLRDDIVGLMRVAEDEARKEDIEIVYAFKELTELVKGTDDGWSFHQADFQYRALQTKQFRALFRITDYDKPFELETIVYCDGGRHPIGQDGTSFDVVSPVMSEVFLDWFCSISVGKKVVKGTSEDIGIIGYAGKRGGIKEFHLLNLFPQENDEPSLLHQGGALVSIIASVNPDIITFVEGIRLLPEDNTDYIKNHLEYGYRLLSEGIDDVEDMAVAINRWIQI